MEPTSIPCPICGTGMKLTVTTNRNGKHAIGVHCPQDGRHFRGFINHRPYVDEALSRLAEVAVAQSEAPHGAGEALQKTSEGPSPRLATKRTRRA